MRRDFLKKRRLAFETLETRDTPALFGLGWSSRDVTVSTVPDGTDSDGAPSNLFAAMAEDGLTADQFNAELNRALLSWAAVANLNFGRVADTGAAIGAVGAPQGDAQFGDVRISARPLDGQVLAITTPPSLLTGTRAGDIVINSNFNFGVGAQAGKVDLYTVLLQETGHALGLNNSTNTSSAMYNSYQGVRAGLHSTDVSAVQLLYDARTRQAGEAPDNFDRGHATDLKTPSATLSVSAKGDIGATTDADFYKSKLPASLPEGAKVIVRTAGVSLLAAHVEIQNDKGVVVAAGSAAPGENVTLAIPGAVAGKDYYVVVRGQAGANALGGYTVTVQTSSTAVDPALESKALTFLKEGKEGNETYGTATKLAGFEGIGTLNSYQAAGDFATATDKDFYEVVQTATDDNVADNVLIVTLRAAAAGKTPYLTLYTSAGVAVSTAEPITGDGDSVRAYQLKGVLPGVKYFVRVSANGEAGVATKYLMNADFRGHGVDFGQVENNTLTAADPAVFTSLYVMKAQAISFNLASVTLGGAAPAGIRATVFDWTGKAVVSWTGKPGDVSSKTVLLMPGEYAIRVDAPVTATTASVAYTLRLNTVSDPIGLDPLDPNYTNPFLPPMPPPTDPNVMDPLLPPPPPPPPPPIVTPPPPTTNPTLPPPDFIFITRPLSYFTWLMPVL